MPPRIAKSYLEIRMTEHNEICWQGELLAKTFLMWHMQCLIFSWSKQYCGEKSNFSFALMSNIVALAQSICSVFKYPNLWYFMFLGYCLWISLCILIGTWKWFQVGLSLCLPLLSPFPPFFSLLSHFCCFPVSLRCALWYPPWVNVPSFNLLVGFRSPCLAFTKKTLLLLWILVVVHLHVRK